MSPITCGSLTQFYEFYPRQFPQTCFCDFYWILLSSKSFCIIPSSVLTLLPSFLFHMSSPPASLLIFYLFHPLILLALRNPICSIYLLFLFLPFLAPSLLSTKLISTENWNQHWQMEREQRAVSERKGKGKGGTQNRKEGQTTERKGEGREPEREGVREQDGYKGRECMNNQLIFTRHLYVPTSVYRRILIPHDVLSVDQTVW